LQLRQRQIAAAAQFSDDINTAKKKKATTKNGVFYRVVKFFEERSIHQKW
jgi:hypothetical protein